MKRIDPRTIASKAQSITFNFSYTERGQNIDMNSLPGDVIMDLNGALWAKSEPSNSVTITVIGGLDTHAFRKDNQPSMNFFLQPGQSQTIRKIAREFAIIHRYDGKILEGNNRDLYEIAYGAFQNGRL